MDGAIRHLLHYNNEKQVVRNRPYRNSHAKFIFRTKVIITNHSPLNVSGDCFFLVCENFVRCLMIHSPPVLKKIIKEEISFRTLIPLFRPGSVHSGSVT